LELEDDPEMQALARDELTILEESLESEEAKLHDLLIPQRSQ